MKSLISAAALLMLLSACANHPPAPVEDRSISKLPPSMPAPISNADRPGFYTVKKGDTLYSIALDQGQSYRDIAAWNYIDSAYTIKVGQVLRVAPDEPAVVVKPIQSGDVVEIRPVGSSTAPVAPVASSTTPAAAAAPGNGQLKLEPQGGKIAYSDAAWKAEKQRAANEAAAAAAPTPAPAPAATPAAPTAVAPPPKPAEPAAAAPAEASDWIWPISGAVAVPFGEGSSKGIDIPAKIGQPVVAANGGTVTLVSTALRGYGNLLVIKHSQSLLSVYAHNNKILVSEGQSIAKGQKVAEAGNTDSDTPKLHFEIRYMGKPVDPLKYLPPR